MIYVSGQPGIDPHYAYLVDREIVTGANPTARLKASNPQRRKVDWLQADEDQGAPERADDATGAHRRRVAPAHRPSHRGGPRAQSP